MNNLIMKEPLSSNSKKTVYWDKSMHGGAYVVQWNDFPIFLPLEKSFPVSFLIRTLKLAVITFYIYRFTLFHQLQIEKFKSSARHICFQLFRSNGTWRAVQIEIAYFKYSKLFSARTFNLRYCLHIATE